MATCENRRNGYDDFTQPNRGARVKAETTEAKDPPHGSVRKG